MASASVHHTVLLRSDGHPVATGGNADGQCDISVPELGIFYVGDLTCVRDVVLQLEAVVEDDAVSLICSSLFGEERFRLTAQGVDLAWEAYKKIAREMNVNSFCLTGSCWPNCALQMQRPPSLT